MKGRDWRLIVLFIAGAVFVNILIRTVDVQWDLTKDKRYTLSDEAKELLRSSDQPLVFTVLLEGNVPSSFRAYRSYIDYYLSEMRRYDQDIEIIYRNPNEGEDADQFRTFLRNQGIDGISRQVETKDEVSQSLIYPYISIHNEKGIKFVDLLTTKKQNESEAEALLRSQLKWESKILRSIKSLEKYNNKSVHLLGSNSRLLAEGFGRDSRTNGRNYVPSNGSIVLQNLDSISAIICVANSDISRSDLLSIDVASQKGIPILWFIDKFDVTLDSLSKEGRYLALHRDFNLEDYLFKLGVKIEPSLVLDLRCSPIPQVTGVEGGKSKTVLLPYPYHILAAANQNSPIYSKTSNPVHFKFVSPLRIARDLDGIDYIPLLQSSQYSQVKNSPVALDFDIMRVQPDPEDYSEGMQILALEINGAIPAYFKARLSTEEQRLLSQLLSNVTPNQKTRQVIFGDASMISPSVGRDGRYFPVGYNNWDRQMYEGNLELFNNLLESLIDGNELMALADRDISLGLIDVPKWRQNKSFYTSLLLGLPILILLSIYILNGYFRKRRYENYKV